MVPTTAVGPARKHAHERLVLRDPESRRTRSIRVRRCLLELGRTQQCEECGLGPRGTASRWCCRSITSTVCITTTAPRTCRSPPELPRSDSTLRRTKSRVRGSGGTADTHGLGPCARKGVGVRIPPSAPRSQTHAEIEFKTRTRVLEISQVETNSETNWLRRRATAAVHAAQRGSPSAPGEGCRLSCALAPRAATVGPWHAHYPRCRLSRAWPRRRHRHRQQVT